MEVLLGWDFPFRPSPLTPFSPFSAGKWQRSSRRRSQVSRRRFTCTSSPFVSATRACMPECAWACLHSVSCVSPIMHFKRGALPPTPPLPFCATVLQSTQTFSNLQALIGVMCCRWGNSKHYWTFPALGRRSCGFGPGRVQFGPHFRTLLAQRKESWRKKASTFQIPPPRNGINTTLMSALLTPEAAGYKKKKKVPECLKSYLKHFFFF